MNTKLHAVADANGRPLSFFMTAGQVSDYTGAAALLDDRSSSFYQPEGLGWLARHLRPGGAFGLWSDALPDEAFLARLAHVFSEVRAEPVTFHNPLQDQPFTQTVYLARTERDPAA